MENSFDLFLEQLRNLNRNKNSKYWDESTKELAPHKPFLLLSIIDGVEQGWITNNRIELTQELKDAFFTYWNAVMGESRNTKVSTPFSHLDYEPFWSLENNRRAIISESIFRFMKEESERKLLRQTILREYFSAKSADLIIEISEMSDEVWEYSKEVNSLADQPFEAYKVGTGKRDLTKKEIQKRDRGFSLSVRRNYDYYCAVCRNKVLTPEGASITEGAHIIPWSESYNDDPRNGISLCRNHHWMFDSKLITVSQDYTIELSPVLMEKENQVYRLDRLKGQEILLPKSERLYPALEALSNHYEKFKSYNEG